MKVKRIALILIQALLCANATAQSDSGTNGQMNYMKNEAPLYKHSIGASLWMLANFFEDPADYYLFTYGYQPTAESRYFVEFNTWKYEEPLGTYGDSEEFYPGYIREFGIGVGYQRFVWNGLFTTVQATPFLKYYYDEQDEKIQNGFQLYLQFVAGYQFNVLQDRLYLEPAYALKYWPIDTNFPDDFDAIREGTPDTIFELSFNFGYRF